VSLRDRLNPPVNKQFKQQQNLEFTLNNNLAKSVILEAKGYGPLDSLLADPTISGIFVNGAKKIYIEKDGKLTESELTFNDNQHLINIIECIVSKVGKKIDENYPIIDIKLADGLRVNAIIPPLALDGPSLSIRKPKQATSNLESLLKCGSLSNEIAQVLSLAVKAKLNIVIIGTIESGKTTLLNALSSIIPQDERIITIEDSAELMLQHENIVRLETDNIEGVKISARDLLVNALKMRPDRIIIGECRGEEAFDMLQSMNSGHNGFLTTLYSNSATEALSRLETISSYSGIVLPEKIIKSQIASVIDLIIQVDKQQDGSRKITSVSEITGMEGTTITSQEIFRFEKTRYASKGIIPKFVEKFKEKNLSIPLEYFDKTTTHTYQLLASASADTANIDLSEAKKNTAKKQSTRPDDIATGTSGLSQRFKKD